MKKRLLSLALILLLCIGLAAPTMAATDLSEGLTKVEVVDSNKKKKYGFADADGNVVIPPKYVQASDFSEGLAAVRLEDNWGFINALGETIIPFEYGSAQSFVNGWAEVSKYYRSLEEYQNETGDKSAITGRFDTHRWGVIDQSGNVVIPIKYFGIDFPSDKATRDSLGVIVCEHIGDNGDSKYGLKYGAYGEIPTVYDRLEYMNYGIGSSYSCTLVQTFISDGVTTIRNMKKGLIGCIQVDGETRLTELLAPEYRDIYPDFMEDSRTWNLQLEGFYVRQLDENGEDKWGYLDAEGDVVLDLIYSSYSDVLKQHAPAVSGGAALFQPQPVGIIIAVAALLIISLVIIVVLVRKKKKSPAMTASTGMSMTEERTPSAPMPVIPAVGNVSAAIPVREQTSFTPFASKICPNCGCQNTPTAKFCKGCGKPVQIPGRCPDCGYQNTLDARFCEGCGKPLGGGEN